MLRVRKRYLSSWNAVVATIYTLYHRPSTKLVVLILLTILQLYIAWWVSELVHLSISLMELWAELARKHLELTL